MDKWKFLECDTMKTCIFTKTIQNAQNAGISCKSDFRDWRISKTSLSNQIEMTDSDAVHRKRKQFKNQILECSRLGWLKFGKICKTQWKCFF